MCSINFYFLLLFLLLSSRNIQARDKFEINVGDNIQILSDKSFRHSATNTFEAIGNVIITHKSNAIYGEHAKISFATGKIDIEGNVRFVGQEMTLYGSSLHYDFKDRSLTVFNARILADNYVIFGKEIKKLGNKTIRAIDAEYTTCRDCPESWSILSSEINITLEEYVRLKHAYMKIKGVTVMYVPYIIFPIKKKRESGLLFPKFALNLETGIYFQQPFYWAINSSSDLTVAPTFWAKRGGGTEFQYRKAWRSFNWAHFNALVLRDDYYPVQLDPSFMVDKKSSNFRYFVDYEQHFTYGARFNGHFYFNDARDLDMVRDFDEYISPKLYESELGGETFFDISSSLMDLSVEALWSKNLLIDDPHEFDRSYIQTIPRLAFATTPMHLFQTNTVFLKSLSFAIDADFVKFRQDHFDEGNYIRNANRLNLKPHLDWRLGHVGPFSFQVKAQLDYQSYEFPHEIQKKNYFKSGLLYESEMFFEIEKVYGKAFKDKTVDPIKSQLAAKTKKHQLDVKDALIIGSFPHPKEEFKNRLYTVISNSYRHSQEIKLKHYYFKDQKGSGNEKFAAQINHQAGRFDDLDALRTKAFREYRESSVKTLPLENTLEIQWNHSVIIKKAKKFGDLSKSSDLRANFDYQEIVFAKVSQGLDLHIKTSNINEKLTRLYVNAGMKIQNWALTFKEYYFYAPRKHLFSLESSIALAPVNLAFTYIVNSFRKPAPEKRAGVSVAWVMNDIYRFTTLYERDIEINQSQRLGFGVTYSPRSRCWKVDFNYEKNLSEKKYLLTFYINYNENGFVKL